MPIRPFAAHPSAHRRILAGTLLLTLLAACGGGGGGAEVAAPPPSPPPPVNQAPQLTVDRFEVDEDQVLGARLAATDAEGHAISFEKSSDPARGVLTLAADGTLSWTPPADFNGSVRFDVTLRDSQGATRTSPVELVARPVNDAPIARDDQLRIDTGAPVTLSLLANDVDVDGDALRISVTSQGRGASVRVDAGNVVTFTPEGRYSGPYTFTYRITDAAGVSADATVRMVVGRFPGLVFVADETTPGVLELYHYDGFRTARLNAALGAGNTLGSVALSADGRRVAYVAASAGFDRVFRVDIATPGTVREVYTSAPKAGSSATTSLRLDETGERVLVRDPFRTSNSQWLLVDLASSGAPRVVGGDNAEIVQVPNVLFGGDGADLWVQAQVGGSGPPVSGSGYTTLYRGRSESPGLLTRVGAVYASGSSQGSGNEMRLTRDGQRLLHVAFTTGPGSTNTWDLLNVDRASDAEVFQFRKFGAFEMPVPNEFDLNAAGNGACFRLNEPGASSSLGPGRFYVSNPRSPGSAVAVSPVAGYNFDCRWASDGRRLAFLSGPTSGTPSWQIVDRDTPLAVATLNAPLGAGEQIATPTLSIRRDVGFYAVQPASGAASLWRVDLDRPGQATRFFSNWPPGPVFQSGRLTLDAEGTMLAYRRGAPGPRLYLVSTETADYEFAVTRSDAQFGAVAAAWLP